MSATSTSPAPSRLLLRILVAVTLGFTVMVSNAGTAHACSCAAPSIQEFLRTSDGAFVGTFVEKGEVDSDGPEFLNTPYHFEINRWIKGSGPETMTVWSSQDGGSCGIEARPGQRVGLFVDEQKGRLSSSLCQQVDPDRLLAAISDDVVVGEGPVHFALAGSFEEGSVALLDSRGRPLGYLGMPAQWGPRVEACPGGSTVLLQIGDGGVQVVNLRTGEGRIIALDFEPEQEYVIDLSCVSAEGDDVMLITERFGGNSSTFTVWRANPEARIVAEVPPSTGHGQPTLAGPSVVIHEQDGNLSRIRLFDPEASSDVVLAEMIRDPAQENFAGFDRPFPSPDGALVGVMELRSPAGDADDDGDATLLVIDVGQAAILGRVDVTSAGYGAGWLSPDFIGIPVVSGDGENSGSMEIFNSRSLERLETVHNWNQFQTVLVGDQLWGTDQSGISTTPLGGGEVTKSHTFAAQPSGQLMVMEEPFEVPEAAAEPRVGGSIAGPGAGLGGPEFENDFEDTASDVGVDDEDGSGVGWLPWLALGMAILLGLAVIALFGRRSSSY